jgi:hypothetical protein
MRKTIHHLAAIAILVPLVSSVQADVTFQDRTLFDSDWEVITHGEGTGTVAQESAEGNPGAFRRVVTLPAGGTVAVINLRRNLVYDPRLLGPIHRLEWSVDSRMLVGFGDGQAVRLILFQNGQFFSGGGYYANEREWTRHSFTSLVATDFHPAIPPIPDPEAHPDFSAAGAPITFGFASVNTYTSIECGFDNHSVTVRCPGVMLCDDTFDNEDWTVLFGTDGGGSAEGQQVASDGNPGAFRQVVNQTGAGSMSAVHLNTQLVYDPRASGPITWLDFAYDSRMLAGFGDGQGGRVTLRQNGAVYCYGYVFENTGEWTPRALNRLTSADFGLWGFSAPGAPPHPDFSATGTPIEFGFQRDNTGGGYRIDCGVDNWRVMINRAPSVTIQVASVAIGWDSLSNLTYQVQYRSEVTGNAWVNLGTPVPGNGSRLSVSDPISGEPRRFYQVVVVP